MNDDLSQLNLGTIESKHTDEYFSYVCSTCHTAFNSSNTLQNCIFCGGKNILNGDKKLFSDYYYVPFSISLNDAFSIYKKQIRYNFLLPFSFRGRKMVKKIQKVYLPCSLYNMSVEGNITFYGAEKIDKIKNAPKQIFECMYTTHFDYLNLLASNFSKIDDVSISNINNYDFSTLETLDSEMMNDSCLIIGDVEKNDITEKVQDRVLKQCANIVRGNVGHELKKLSDNHMVVGISSAKSVFIPVYFINFRYQGHEYLFLLNGQTKKMIVDLPISKWNVILFCILCFLFFVVVGCIVVHFI